MFKKIRNGELYRVLSLLGNKLPVYITAVIIHSLISAICLNIVLAYIMKDAVNAVMNGQWPLIKRALEVASISLTLGMILTPLSSYTINYLANKMIKELRLKTFRHMEELSIKSIDRDHSGDIISRLTNDVKVIEDIYTLHIPRLSFSIIFGIAAIVSIFTLEWEIGLIVIMIGIGSIIIGKLFSKPIRKAADSIQISRGGLTKVLVDLLEGFQIAKIFGIENTLFEHFMDKNNELVEGEDRQAKSNASLNLTNNIYGNMRYLGLAVLGFIIAARDSSDVGSVAAIIHLQGNASYLFDNIGAFISGIQTSLAGAKRVFEFLDMPGEKEPSANRQDKKSSTAVEIGMRNVSFSYDESCKTVDNVSFTVNKGEIAAFVGPSGGGKSSILKLLMGFYPPYEGRIMIMDRNIGGYSLTQLRDLIAYVPQDAYLFSGTIEENIRYGKPGASKEEVINAARAAYAHDFILEQPDGYDTIIGEKGARLSGGQRQRIAIARALLKDAPVLLLDEATSALDSESEQLVQQALNVLMKGRTTIAVAHRLSTIENANIIYVIDKGQVVEQGTHRELVENSIIYKHLHELQFRSDEETEGLVAAN